MKEIIPPFCITACFRLVFFLKGMEESNSSVIWQPAKIVAAILTQLHSKKGGA
jgi:hypothetical protein